MNSIHQLFKTGSFGKRSNDDLLIPVAVTLYDQPILAGFTRPSRTEGHGGSTAFHKGYVGPERRCDPVPA